MDILNSDSSDDDTPAFKINKNYAQHYETWRKKEEHQKLKDRYGEDAAHSSSSSSDEEEIRSTKQMDKDWLRTYAVVRFNQPRLHKEGVKFFNDEAKPVSTKKKEKAVTLKDHERKFILEKGGIESEEDEESTPKPQGKSYFEEQDEIKKSIKDAVADSSDEESDDDDLLVKKQKTQDDEDKEENDFLEWLKGNKKELDDPEAEAELAPLKAYWNDPNLNENEKVLRDYVLNNGYMDQEDSDDSDDGDVDLNEDKSFIAKAEEYEHTYNFRHEEPGGDEIKSYPRVIETSVRPKDTRRTEARQKKKEKQRQHKDKEAEEIRLLQKLTREEKMMKLEALRNEAQKPDLEYDLDADFDPDEHNRIMQKYFDEDYYGESANKKPTFEFDAAIDDDPDDPLNMGDGEEVNDEEDDDEQGDDDGEKDNDIDELADKPSTSQEKEEEMYDDDANFNMDADFDPNRDYTAQKRSERRRAKKYGEAFAKKLPLFDPTTKTFDEYIDEYLKDKINTLPFTYREVVPNDFGLSTEEILKAPDRELNSWVGVKKMSQYRSRQEEMADVKKFSNKSKIAEKKYKVLPSLLKEQEKIEEETAARKKKKKKRKKKKTEDDDKTMEDEPLEIKDEQSDDSVVNGESSSSFKTNKKRKMDDALVADVVSPKKKKKVKLSEEAEDQSSSPLENVIKKTEDAVVADVVSLKKKKKLKLAEDQSSSPSENVIKKTEDAVVADVVSPKKKKKLKLSEEAADQSSSPSENVIKKTEDAVVADVVSPKKIKKVKLSDEVEVQGSSPSERMSKKMERFCSAVSFKEKKKVPLSDEDQELLPDISEALKKNNKFFIDGHLKNRKARKKRSVDPDKSKGQNDNMASKKKKGKKISIANFQTTDSGNKIALSDSKLVKRRLKDSVMSTSRMSKFGIGPGNKKSKSKKNKIKKNGIAS